MVCSRTSCFCKNQEVLPAFYWKSKSDWFHKTSQTLSYYGLILLQTALH